MAAAPPSPELGAGGITLTSIPSFATLLADMSGAQTPSPRAHSPTAALSRPDSRAAHMRPRVGAVTSQPPPGSYDGPIAVTLRCETPDAEIRITRDGTTPYANSDRDHGYRCERFVPGRPIQLAGVGRHVITAVATAPGCIEGRPKALVFTLTSGAEPKRPRSEVLRERAMDRQFMLTASHDATLPFQRAKTPKRSGSGAGRPIRLALADTTNARQLARLRAQGAHVELFRVAATAGREAGYKRVVPPSLAVSIPPDPLREGVRDSPPPSLRSQPEPAPITYDAPRLLGIPDRSGGPDADPEPSHVAGSAVSAAGSFRLSRPVSRALTSAGRLRTRGSVTPTAAAGAPSTWLVPRPRAATPGAATSIAGPSPIGRPPPSRLSSAAGGARRPPTGSSRATAQQLDWFETRGQMTAASPDDDAEDAVAEAVERERRAAAIEGEVLRVGRISERFEKTYTAVNPVTSDVAGDSRRLLSLLLHASAARRTPLRRLLCMVPYRDIAAAVERRASVTPVELAAIPGVSLGQPVLARALREVGAPPTEADTRTSLPVPQLLLLLRYIVWHERPVPEAVLALAAQSKAELPVAAERVVTRVEAAALLDAYRRTRGAHPAALMALHEAVFGGGLKWGETDEVELEAWQAATAAIPIVDAALADMARLDHPMYAATLPVYR